MRASGASRGAPPWRSGSPSPAPALCGARTAGRVGGSAALVLEDVAHPAREALDVPERVEELGRQLGFVQQQELGLGEDGREGVGQIVAKFRDWVVGHPEL